MSSDSISEIMASLMFMGRLCAGCQRPVEPDTGLSCFCADELPGALGVAHDRLVWHNESCLYETHEDPTWPDLEELRFNV